MAAIFSIAAASATTWAASTGRTAASNPAVTRPNASRNTPNRSHIHAVPTASSHPTKASHHADETRP